MDKKKYQWVFIFLIVAFLTASGVAYAFLGGMKWTGTFQAAPADIVWEYRVVTIPLGMSISDGAFEKELNGYGREGWELLEMVFTTPKIGNDTAAGYYIMKRIQP